jgi:CheY-like chemotaxis protein
VSFNILIVEDNTDSRNLLHFCLTSKGFNAVTANNGAEGLNMVQAEKPDLIITDLTMPNGSGVEMIRQIRSNPETANIPIVIYTAQVLESAEKAIQAGASKAFYKPTDLDEMIQYITAFLNNLTKCD